MLSDTLNFDPDRAAAYLEQGLWNNDTLSGWLRGHAARTPDAPALISSSKTLSYAELKNDVDRLAYGLTGLGLVKGDVVAVQLPNIPEFLTTYLAIASFGGLMQTIHMPYGRSDIEFLLGHSGARVVISLAAFKEFPTQEIMLDCRRKLSTLEHVIVLGPEAGK